MRLIYKKWRLEFWTFVMDVSAEFGGFGSRLYLLAVKKASDAACEVSQSPPAGPNDGGDETPF